jgi:predicted HicB family RNase H-like nuclease
MTYKGYDAIVNFDDQASIFHGEVVNTRDVITFQGTSVRELQKAFRQSVDDYLDFCRERGEVPDKPYSGKFLVRVPADIHRRLAIRAALKGMSLNAYVRDLLAHE